ncbi:serine hydrolase domain-containing protein [Chitinophaga solisilvae]|uniref:serine hydrolase domain-containing protein n=1 Tax=Chitinophaga solisilvae TaxID=1233460 RepID=UPI0013718F4E|nr:serine hydrolase domain-containing protein [Chitinophaga solisilvae]
MKNCSLSLIIFALLILSIQLNARQAPITRLPDSLFREMNRYGVFNGAAMIAENGKVIYQHAYGYADFSLKKLNDNQTTFALGSVSKIFTAIAILQLRDNHRLSLGDPLTRYIPAFPYPDITIRHLLTQTSGLPDYELFEKAVAQQPEKKFYNADIIPYLKARDRPLAFKPGSQWQYCNLNFCLLALLVEKVSGKPFENYVTTKIFKPAGMRESYFYTGTSKDRPSQQAANHDYPFYFSSMPVNADSIQAVRWRTYNLNGLLGQGNIYTTTGDMIKFDQALYGHRLLKPATLAEAFTPAKLNDGSLSVSDNGPGNAAYGLGWFILQDTTFGKVVFHTGGVPGAASIFIRNLTGKQALMLFDNTISPGLFRNAANILRALYGQQPVPVKKSLTREYATTLLSAGVDAAFTKLIGLKADSLHYTVVEYELNDLGLQLLYASKSVNHQVMALEVLRLNILLFPQSFNTYDSYAEALAFTGNQTEAIEMYKRSLVLNPDNKSGKKALDQLLNN